jgi:hypothetical protein
MPQNKEERLVEYERLNALGKVIFLGGGAVRLAANLIDVVLTRAADVAVDAEKAFRQGLDPNVEDAKILDEREEK